MPIFARRGFSRLGVDGETLWLVVAGYIFAILTVTCGNRHYMWEHSSAAQLMKSIDIFWTKVMPRFR